MADFGRGGKCAEKKAYNMVVLKVSKELFSICKELSKREAYKEFIGDIYKEFKEGLDTKTKYIN